MKIQVMDNSLNNKKNEELRRRRRGLRVIQLRLEYEAKWTTRTMLNGRCRVLFLVNDSENALSVINDAATAPRQRRPGLAGPLPFGWMSELVGQTGEIATNSDDCVPLTRSAN